MRMTICALLAIVLAIPLAKSGCEQDQQAVIPPPRPMEKFEGREFAPHQPSGEQDKSQDSLASDT